MRNLIKFIWKNQYTFLFILLEIVAFSALFSSNSFHQSVFRRKTNEIRGTALAGVNSVSTYFNLSEVNASLMAENALLKNKLYALENDSPDSILFELDSVQLASFIFSPARILNSSVNKQNNIIVIDKGSKHGVEPEMGLIGPNGVLGIIKDVSENYATAISLLNRKTKLSAKFTANSFFGLLEWDGNNPCCALLSDIPFHVKINVNDTIVTRGSSGIFPPDIPIGQVEEFELAEGSSFYKIKIKLFSDFYKLNYAYYLISKDKNEITELEQKFNNDLEN
jgi:rod shape-determining protein MreC